MTFLSIKCCVNRWDLRDILTADSGIRQMMAWGVEELEICERAALAVNAGVDIISGSYDLEDAKEAYRRWKEGYYTVQGHKVPEGYTAEQITLSEEALTRAVERTLIEKFQLGLFENPYRNPEEAVKIVAIRKTGHTHSGTPSVRGTC